MFKFAGSLFSTRQDLINAVVHEWLTAGGGNSVAYCREALETDGPEALADEMVGDGWAADVAFNHDVTRDEWIDAMRTVELDDDE